MTAGKLPSLSSPIFIAWGDDVKTGRLGKEIEYDSKVLERGAICVIFDILRASTTIAVLLEQGAKEILLAGTVEDAHSFKEDNPSALLCGERFGHPPLGFDYGNSPVQFRKVNLAGRSIILTTSNFTRIFMDLRNAGFTDIYSCSIVNISPVANHVAERARMEGKLVILIAAGPSSDAYEDMVGIHWFLDALGTPETQLIGEASKDHRPVGSRPIKEEVLSRSRHARFLINEGKDFEQDVDFSLQLDLIRDIVPKCDAGANILRNAVSEGETSKQR